MEKVFAPSLETRSCIDEVPTAVTKEKGEKSLKGIKNPSLKMKEDEKEVSEVKEKYESKSKMYDKVDIFDTPQLRYDKFRKKFDRKYLNPKAWDYEFDSKEIVQAYHDLLEFLEETESFRELTKLLNTDIPVDNVHLVLDDLPFTLKQREKLIDYVVAGKPPKPMFYSHEDKLLRIKEFCKMEKERGLYGMEIKSGIQIMDYRRALREREAVYEDIEKVFEDDAKNNAFDEENERSGREKEILEIRQKVYLKLKRGQNAFPILKMLKRKVEKFLENYRTDLSYHEERNWREKVIITEKAVIRNKIEIKAANQSRKDENLAPLVEEVVDAAKAQELVIENLSEPLQVGEIEEKLKSVKKFKKKLLRAKKKGAAGKDSKPKISKVKANENKKDVKVNKNADSKGNDVEKRANGKDDIFDMNYEVTEHDDDDSENEKFDNEVEEDVVEKCTESKRKRKCKNDEKIDENLAPNKKGVFDAVRAQEIIIENIAPAV